MNVSFTAKLVKQPEIKFVGKKKTALTKLEVLEDRGKYGDNNFIVEVWGDKALEAQMLEVGDDLDFTAYEDENGNFRYRAIVDEETWEYNNKSYSKLKITAFEWEVL